MNKRLVLMSCAAAGLGAYVLFGEGGFLSGLLQRSVPVIASDTKAGGSQATSAVDGKPRDGIKLNPLEGLDVQSFAAIVEQPLFNPGRMPRPVEEPPPPPEPVDAPEPQAEPVVQDTGPVAGDYRLLAVSSGPAGRVAALRLNQSSEVIYVREGQDVQQWKVLTLGPRSIVIGTPEQNVEVVMFENTDGPAEVPSDGSSDVPQEDDGLQPDLPTPSGQPPAPPDPQPEDLN